ncbi:MAG: hypothetical protein JW748_01410 [Anaerolineales bacterium]|nr:hypothetical protein [Anaerolineales bacterium]
MSTPELISMILAIGGVLLILASFADMEMITGLWVAGDIERDPEFIEAGRFKKRVYWVLRIAGVLAFVAGLIIMSRIG